MLIVESAPAFAALVTARTDGRREQRSKARCRAPNGASSPSTASEIVALAGVRDFVPLPSLFAHADSQNDSSATSTHGNSDEHLHPLVLFGDRLWPVAAAQTAVLPELTEPVNAISRTSRSRKRRRDRRDEPRALAKTARATSWSSTVATYRRLWRRVPGCPTSFDNHRKDRHDKGRTTVCSSRLP